MRAGLIGAALAAGFAASMTIAQAQRSPLGGPLEAPGETLAAAPGKVKPKPHKAHHAKAKPAKAPAPTQDAAAPDEVPGKAPAAGAAAPTDALDLGMKWNGNNDGAAQTKFQSGPNTSSGSGAEVGMKLHF